MVTKRQFRRVKPVHYSSNAILWDAAPHAWVITDDVYFDSAEKDDDDDVYIPVVIVRLGKDDKIEKSLFSARRIDIDGLTGYYVEESELDATFK